MHSCLKGALTASALIIGLVAFSRAVPTISAETRQNANPEALMEADRAFSVAVQTGGADAWASWFADDGAVVQEGVGEIRGREAVRELMAVLDSGGVSLSWEPERADIAASGDLGWTTGRYVSENIDAGGAVTRAEGVYVTIWRLQTDGTWKVVMDLGNPT